MCSDLVIKATGVKKRYEDNYALDGIDIEVNSGQILGFIGPNGAGKSTFLQSVLGLINTEGNLEVLGLDPRKDRHKLLKEVCSITDVAVLPKWMTVDQVLNYVDGVHPGFDLKKCLAILSRTNIKRSSKIKTLSRGMVVQLHLSIVMSIDAKLLVLDEPTLGLDLVYRKEFYSQLIEDYYDGDKTILISTHQVEEIEGVLSNAIFMNQGRIVMQDSIESINKKFLELRPTQDSIERAKSLRPIHSRMELGREVFLYEDTEQDKLSEIGEVRPPIIADLFMAIMEKTRKGSET
ncbi:MAG: ABC transporter ATP-binding protein [Gammaproteobacteria bacterium]|nr:MAG: ABC transporter ATP-binding protein [Gammaproteobacteria bacterium]|tara:strand:+ start:5082 stop:5957 length:876 start_codon:yes stop_codon:yes gene_type:complete